MAEIETAAIELPRNEIVEFCRRYGIIKLALFGSVLSDRFGAGSDVDVLVTFDPEAQVGFLRLSRMQRELEEMLGYPVDLVPESGLKPLIREEVLATSQVIYAS